MRVYACLHVVVGAGPAGPAVEVALPRRGDEEVVLARVELQPPWCRTKRPKNGKFRFRYKATFFIKQRKNGFVFLY